MILDNLERYRDVGLLVTRLGFGLGFAFFHGWPKITGGTEMWTGVGSAIGNYGIEFGHQWFGLAAGLTEFVGGLCLAAGLFFRPAAIALSFVMVTATINHLVTGQGTPAHAFKNFFVLVGFSMIGPGRYSLDHVLWGRERPDAATVRSDAVGEPI